MKRLLLFFIVVLSLEVSAQNPTYTTVATVVTDTTSTVQSPLKPGKGIIRFKSQASQNKWQVSDDGGTTYYRMLKGNLLDTRIPKWSSSGFLTSGMMYDNGSGVGVGTTIVDKFNITAPSQTSVTGTGAFGGLHFVAGINNGVGGFTINRATSDNLAQGAFLLKSNSSTGTTAHIGTTDDFGAGVKERLRIDQAGRVGMGTTSMVDRVGIGVSGTTISGTSAYGGLQFISSVDNGVGGITINRSASDVLSQGGILLKSTLGSGTSIIFGTTNDFGVGFTERARIIESGNFGINDSSPSFRLDVNGTIASQSLTSGRLPYISTGGSFVDEAALAYDDTNNAMVVTNSASTFIGAYYGGEIQFDQVGTGDDLTMNINGITRSDASSPGGDTFTISNSSGDIHLEAEDIRIESTGLNEDIDFDTNPSSSPTGAAGTGSVLMGGLGVGSGQPFKVDGGGNMTATKILVTTGVEQDGGGLKHQTCSTGSIAAGASGSCTITWGTAFADATYTVTTGVEGVIGFAYVTSKTASAVTIFVLNAGVASQTYTVNVIAFQQ
jgi:hypothetical protein